MFPRRLRRPERQRLFPDRAGWGNVSAGVSLIEELSRSPNSVPPLVVVQGETSPTAGRLYLRLTESIDHRWDNVELVASLVGPFHQYGQTLPSTISFRSMGASSAGLCQATVPDPCSWTIDTPMLYRVDVNATRDGRIIWSGELPFGFRRFGVHGRYFSSEGQPWVMRAARDREGRFDWDGWRAARLVRWIEQPTDGICEAASCCGVPLLVDLTRCGSADVADEIRRVGQWPAVFALVVAGPADKALRRQYPSIAFGLGCPLADDFNPAGGVDFVVVDESAAERWDTRQMAEQGVVVLVRRTVGSAVPTIDQWRDRCDQLQLQLAPADFAGYVVE